MKPVKINVGYHHPRCMNQSEWEWQYNDEVYLNMHNVQFVTPFDVANEVYEWRFYAIQLVEGCLYSRDNPFDLMEE